MGVYFGFSKWPNRIFKVGPLLDLWQR